MGDKADRYAVKLLNDLRKNGVKADKDYLQRKVKGQMKQADRLNARYTIVVGEQELEENKINDSLEFNIVNSGDADYTKPVIYSNCQNPITLEYVNTNIEEDTIISDISTPLTYDGSLLKKSGIFQS